MDNNGKNGPDPDKKKNPLDIDPGGTKSILNPEAPEGKTSDRPFVSGSKADLFSGQDVLSGQGGHSVQGEGRGMAYARTDAGGTGSGSVRNPDDFRASREGLGNGSGEGPGGQGMDVQGGSYAGSPYTGGSGSRPDEGSRADDTARAVEQASAYSRNAAQVGWGANEGPRQYSYEPPKTEGGAEGSSFVINGTVITHVPRQEADFAGRRVSGMQGPAPETPGAVQCDLGKIRMDGSITIGRADFTAAGGSTILMPPYASRMFGPQAAPGSSWAPEELRYASKVYRESYSRSGPLPYGSGEASGESEAEDAPSEPYGSAPPYGPPPPGGAPSSGDAAGASGGGFSSEGAVVGGSTLADKTGGTVKARGAKARNTVSDTTRQTMAAPAYIVMNGAISLSGDVGNTVNMVRFPAKVCKDVFSITVVDRLKWSMQNAQTDRRNAFIDSVFGSGAAKNGGRSIADVRKKYMDELEKAGVKGLDRNVRGAREQAQARKIKRKAQSELRKREKQGLGSTPQLDRILKAADDGIKCGQLDENPIKEKGSTKMQKGTALLRDINMIIDRQLMKSDAGKAYVQTRRVIMTGVRQIRKVVKTARRSLRALKRMQLAGAKDKVERLTKKIEKNKAWGLGTPGQNERLEKRLNKAVDKKAKKSFRMDKTAQRKNRFNARRNRLKEKMPSSLAKKAVKKAGKKAGSAIARQMEKRAVTRLALRAAKTLKKVVGKVLQMASSALSTVMVYVWIGVAIAAAVFIIMILLENLYVNMVTGVFNFGNAEDVMYNAYCSYTDVANSTLLDCYMTDMERMVDYAKKHATYSDTSHVEMIDYDDMDYYAELKDLDDAEEQILESTNAAEILSMVYTYFGLDPEGEDYDEDDEDHIAYIDLVDVVQQYYYYTHEITAKESVTYEVRETGEMIVDEETGESVPETETVPITNVDFTYESYYFPDIFSRVEEFSQQKALKETPFYNYSTNYYGTVSDEQDVYVALRAAGFTHAGTCGIMGNLMQESGINPNSVNGSYNGIAQWGNNANAGFWWQDVVQYCNDNGYDLYSLTGQTNYLITSIKEDYSSGNKSLYGLLTTSNDVDKCAEVFCALYENCADSAKKASNIYHYSDEYPARSSYYQDLPTRVRFAESLDSKYSGIQDTWEDYVVNAQGQAVVDYALQFVGNPYVWGGTSLTNGCDCSGFVMKVYEHFGVSLPHSSTNLRSVGVAVSESEMQPGDIICFEGHCGIYIGNNQMVHAKGKDYGIVISSYPYTKTTITIRRIFT